MPQEVYCGFQVTGMIEWGKNQNPKTSLGLPTKPQKHPIKGWVLDPEDLKRKNRGLWTVYLGKMRQRVDRRQPFFLRLSWQGTESKKEGIIYRKVESRSDDDDMPQTFFFAVFNLVSDFLSQWDLVCERRHLKAMTQSVYMGGLLVGSVAFSTLSDHFGRKVVVFLSILIMVSIARTVFEMWLFELFFVNSWNQCQQSGDFVILRSFCLTSKVGAQSLRPRKMGGENQNFHPYDEKFKHRLSTVQSDTKNTCVILVWQTPSLVGKLKTYSH